MEETIARSWKKVFSVNFRKFMKFNKRTILCFVTYVTRNYSRFSGQEPCETCETEIIMNSCFQCYMYCLWEQFGLVDDKRELSLNGMLTFFQRIPAYRAEVQRAVSECKRIGKYFGIYGVVVSVCMWQFLEIFQPCLFLI